MASILHLLKLCNGVGMPNMGLGTWHLKGNNAKNAINIALKAGYTLIDTGSIYGNEAVIAECLQNPELKHTTQLIPTGSKNPHGIFLSSKPSIHEMGYDNVLNACSKSLERLQISHLDLYMLHWPGLFGKNQNPKDARKMRHQSWKAMESLYFDGLVRAIGVCNFLPRHVEGLVEDGIEVMPMVNQIELHPLCWSSDILQWAAQYQIILQAYSPLGTGSKLLLENNTVVEIAQINKCTPAQVLLRWSLQKGFSVIPRSSNESRICQNLNVGNFELSQSQMSQLDNLNKDKHFCWNSSTVE